MRFSTLVALCVATATASAQQNGVILQVGNDARVSRLVACYVPEGSVPSTFASTRQPITFRGKIDIALRDRFTFTVEGNGTFDLRIDGQAIELGKPTRLTKGKLDLVATWTPQAKGDTWTRLSWECGEWGCEPVPPKFLSYASDDAVLAKAAELRRGRELFAMLKCAKCHAPATPFDPATSMPELGYEAPSLLDVATRLEPAWIARWLEDPKAVRPSARMPKLLKGESAAQDARDIAAFLVAFGKKPEPTQTPAATPDQVSGGAKLFAGLGCIGCHTKPEDKSSPQDGRIPLRQIAAKFRGDHLAGFLRTPTSHHAGTRMPTFGLTETEARDLAAWLRTGADAPLAELARPTDAQHGRELVQSLGCAHCHAETAHALKPVADLAKITPKAAGGAACSGTDFGLAPADQKAISAFMASDLGTLRKDSRAEHFERQFQELRCAACHTRDRQQDLWSQLAGEVATLAPQGTETSVGAQRPHLTWAGEKLQTAYVEKLLAGRVTEPARPWLFARMPAWPGRAQSVAEGLALTHGCSPSWVPAKNDDPALAEQGKKLVGADGGFTCIQCHAIGAQKATQVFEAEGVNFNLAKQRLRIGYVERWIWNPLRIDVSTKMPRYVDKQGKTQIGDGDAKKQIAAIWHFLLGL